MIGEQTGTVLAGFEAAVDALLAAPVDGLDALELARVLQRIETQRRRLEAVDQQLIAAADRAGLASTHGQPRLADVLVRLLRIDPGEAKARVGRAADLGPRVSLVGEQLQPCLPATAEAVRDGRVSGEQAQVIVDCLDQLSPAVSVEASGIAERVLLQAAGHEYPRALRRTAAELIARLDPDGLEPTEEQVERRRGFTLLHRGDGSSAPRGVWTAELTALVETILDSLAAPQPTEGLPDERSAAQRRHDALAEAATRLLTSATLPANAGVPVTILATTTIRELQEGVGLAALGHGQRVSIAKLLQLAGAAAVVPVVFNDAGGVLAYGRARRLADHGQRLALAARDGGCSFPGCDRPAAWTEAHHILEWTAHTGPTDLDNLTLLCRYHHANFARLGWAVEMNPTDLVPDWIPPPWLDPDQQPLRNQTAHRPAIDFRRPALT